MMLFIDGEESSHLFVILHGIKRAKELFLRLTSVNKETLIS